MAKRTKANDSYGDPYSVWRDYSNPRDVGDETNVSDALDYEKPRGQGGDPMTVKPDHPVVINWFRGKKKRKR